MNIRALRAFVELVKQKSFTSAADALCVTQPTISKLIKQLESELDLSLMLRHGHQFELTPAGQLIYQRGADILQRMGELDVAVQEFRTSDTGLLKLGMPPTVGTFFFGEILTRFHEQYPHIQTQLVEDGAENIAAMVLAGQLDVGIAMLPVTSELATRPFINDDLYFIARKPSPWQDLSKVHLTDLREAEFVLFPESFTLSKRLEQAFDLRQQSLNVSARSAQWKFIRALVQASKRCTIMPATIAQHFDDTLFHKARILDADQNWHLALVWRDEEFMPRPLKVWLELCDALLPRVVE